MVPSFCSFKLVWPSYGFCKFTLSILLNAFFITMFLYCFILKILVCAIMSGFRKSGHILDSFFTGVANTSSTPTGWEGSHEVAGKSSVFTKTSQMASIGAIFTSTDHTKQLNPWPNSPASRVVNYSWLSACQGDM